MIVFYFTCFDAFFLLELVITVLIEIVKAKSISSKFFGSLYDSVGLQN